MTGKRLVVLVAILLLAADASQRARAAEMEAKLDACAAAPSHACVFDLLWDHVHHVGRDFRATALAAFVETAVLTGDEALIDEYTRRTEWRNRNAMEGFRIKAAAKLKDRAALVSHADRATAGARYDWYDLRALAGGLARIGERERALLVAERIPHGPNDNVTAQNLYRGAQNEIAFHAPAPVSLRMWADRVPADRWWKEDDLAFFREAATKLTALGAGAAELGEVATALRARAGRDGWLYMRALARLAPEMTASDRAAAAELFGGYVRSWADPNNDDIAEFVLVIAARSQKEAREAMLAAFDARRPSPSARLARIRALAEEPDAALPAADVAFLQMAGGTLEQVRAATARASLTREELLAAARAGEGAFSEVRPEVLHAALHQADDPAYATAIATLMVELAEGARSGDSRKLAQSVAEWARDTCQADIFRRAERRLARPDDPPVDMWRARLNGDPVSPIRLLADEPDRLSNLLPDILRAYEPIILNGVCPAE